MSVDNRLRVLARTRIRKLAYVVIGLVGFVAHFRPRPMSAGMSKVLVIRLDLLGDVLFTMPLVEGLRNAYPNVRIEMLVLPYTMPLAQLYPSVDNVVPLDTNLIRRPQTLFSRQTWREYFSVARYIRSRHFDLAISVNGRMASLCAFLSGAKRAIGYAGDSYPHMLTDVLPGKRYLERKHEVEYVRALAAAVGARDVPSHLHIPDSENRKAPSEFLVGSQRDGPLVVIHAGSVNDPAKRWPASSWAKLADVLQGRLNAQIVLVGAGSDEPIAKEVVELANAEIQSLVGQTDIPALIDILSQADLVASADSGPLHLAVALGRPVIGIYGPTDPAIYGPYNPNAAAAVHYDPQTQRIDSISVDQVVASALELLDGPEP